jgi:plasmid stability protein
MEAPMAQLTVYIDDDTRKRIEVAARRANTSVSQWVKERLSSALETEWPNRYFELLGALKGVNIERAPQLRPEDDVNREPV